MKAYLDTSSLIAARGLSSAPRGVTRPHSVAEFYGTVTGRGITVIKDGTPVRHALAPQDAVELISKVFAKVEFCDLTAEQMTEDLPEAVKANVQGPNIHDFMHAAAASRAGCQVIVTGNAKDFRQVTSIRLISPADYFTAK